MQNFYRANSYISTSIFRRKITLYQPVHHPFPSVGLVLRVARLFYQKFAIIFLKSRFGRRSRPIFTFSISHNFLVVLMTKRDIRQLSTIWFTIPYKHENRNLKTDAKLLDSFTFMLNVATWHWYRSVKEEMLYEICIYLLTAC